MFKKKRDRSRGDSILPPGSTKSSVVHAKDVMKGKMSKASLERRYLVVYDSVLQAPWSMESLAEAINYLSERGYDLKHYAIANITAGPTSRIVGHAVMEKEVN